ncbi:hypothetical protein ISN44_As08g004510 [Arabidopsis suecica]|uniref:Uncharacterized protein n=1 Tax=Arabidopsis suecica TaxID=45249 RepID=A0A8T2B0C9_ARASU|nr:hypothetical protein ISN44_As08g004510 [Arabidopsis suecica]
MIIGSLETSNSDRIQLNNVGPTLLWNNVGPTSQLKNHKIFIYHPFWRQNFLTRINKRQIGRLVQQMVPNQKILPMKNGYHLQRDWSHVLWICGLSILYTTQYTHTQRT